MKIVTNDSNMSRHRKIERTRIPRPYIAFSYLHNQQLNSEHYHLCVTVGYSLVNRSAK